MRQNEASSVFDWFDANGRDLPWRDSRDPWEILVAEVMLQQTQVGRVIEKWPEFLAKFPNPKACAGSPTGAVIEAWAGLGFNRRAVSIHAAATVIVDFHEGRVPDGLAELLALPGVGQYTARAIRAFAFEFDDAVVDTNVARIVARRNGKSMKPAHAQAAADAALPTGHGWLWNQAMLDIGATLCVARQPKCYQGCPLRGNCRWFESGLAGPDPAVGSAGVSKKQSRFDGSDRQGRGRLVDALRDRSIQRKELASIMGWPQDQARATRVADQVVADGLAEEVDGAYFLPH